MKKCVQLNVMVVALIITLFPGCVTTKQMTMKRNNKATVEKYMAGFNAGDHAAILFCLTEDVVWELPGVYHHRGKAAFDQEIENAAFTGKPVIKVSRMTEEDNVVIAEGTVQAKKKDGTILQLAFVFEMENGLIKKLTSYLVPIQA